MATTQGQARGTDDFMPLVTADGPAWSPRQRRGYRASLALTLLAAGGTTSPAYGTLSGFRRNVEETRSRSSPSEVPVIPFRQWQPRHLFRSWIAYWLVLLAAVAWRPFLEYWRISRSPTGHGTVGANYSGGMLPLALWIAGPPLVLFLLWLATRSHAPEPERKRMD